MAGFEDLNDDVLFILLGFFSLERFIYLKRLRLVSWRLKDFAESQMFKHVTVGDSEEQIDWSNRIKDRLLSPNDTLSRHVRTFTVASFEGDDASACLNSDIFVRLMKQFQGLYSFSWNTDHPMPSKVLEAFHTLRPYTRLCVSTKTFDPVLFLSPQLYSLKYSVACKSLYSPPTRSYFRQLRNVLSKSTSIRILVLEAHNDPRIYPTQRYTDIGPLRLPLQSGDRLPAIQSLDIQVLKYDFDAAHCALLLEALDFTKLKRLSFGASCPGDFFRHVPGKIPNLESLEFGYQHNSQYGPALFQNNADSTTSLIRFISSLRALKEIAVRSLVIDLACELWSVIGQKHGAGMRQISIRGSGTVERWGIDDVRIVYLDSLGSWFPYLRKLDISLPLVHSRLIKGSLEWGAPEIRSIARLGLLRDLSVSAKVARYGDQSLDSFLAPHVHQLLNTLWEAFFDNDSTSELITITANFWRWEDQMPYRGSVTYFASKPGEDFKIEKQGKDLSSRLPYDAHTQSGFLLG